MKYLAYYKNDKIIHISQVISENPIETKPYYFTNLVLSSNWYGVSAKEDYYNLNQYIEFWNDERDKIYSVKVISESDLENLKVELL